MLDLDATAEREREVRNKTLLRHCQNLWATMLWKLEGV